MKPKSNMSKTPKKKKTSDDNRIFFSKNRCTRKKPPKNKIQPESSTQNPKTHEAQIPHIQDPQNIKT